MVYQDSRQKMLTNEREGNRGRYCKETVREEVKGWKGTVSEDRRGQEGRREAAEGIVVPFVVNVVAYEVRGGANWK